MSRLFKGYTLNEGYNDLGTLTVDITFVEAITVPQRIDTNEPGVITSPVFQVLDSSTGTPLADKKIVFTIERGNGAGTQVISTQFTNNEGYAAFPIPLQPTMYVADPDVAEIPVYMLMSGIPAARSEEAYLLVNDGTNDYYTLIRDMMIVGEYLKIKGFQLLYINSKTYSGVLITPDFEVFIFEPSTSTWDTKGFVDFYQFSNPAGLDPGPEDGLYEESAGSGTITSGALGTGTFDQYSISVLNPTVCPVLITVAVYEPDGITPIYTEDLGPISPDTKNITKISFAYVAPVITDTTPTIADVETAAGITFSTDFKTFLNTNDLDTLQDIRNAGPLKYITGIPDPEASEVGVLQSYVDLYFITNELVSCTALRDSGYNSVYDIAMVPRDVFISDMGLSDAYTFVTARIHEMAVQRTSLVTNLLAASLNDLQLRKPVGYVPEDSPAYSVFRPTCDCDDCKSGVSPFAYLTDLIKYGAAHITKTGTYSPGNPVNYGAFLTLLKNTFYQPFGDLPVDCDTLHEEFCRVRLATEVLKKLFDYIEDDIPADKITAFENATKQYLQVTYNTLLVQMGTSFDEVRAAVTEQAEEVQDELMLKLSTKLGIPVYIPGSDPDDRDFTVKYLFLVLGGAVPNDLTAVRLEAVFGFRDIDRNVLTPTPESSMSAWREVYLKSSWANTDYPLSAYTREGVNPLSPDVNDDWKPIIDPDIISYDDMRFFPPDYIPVLYLKRKENTDGFLSFYKYDPSILERTNADINSRIVRVSGIDVTGDIVDENKIRLNNGSTWMEFPLLNKTASGTNVDFILSRPTPAMFQPDGSSPKMRYNRRTVINSYTQLSGHDFKIVLPQKASDMLALGYAKLLSVNGATQLAYATDLSSPWEISAVVVDSGNPTNVTLTLSNDPDSTFLDGNLFFVYEKEVDLFTDEIPSPVDLVYSLFNIQQSYTRQDTTVFSYDVWSDGEWSSGLPSEPATYIGLKTVWSEISSGINVEHHTSIIEKGLHLNVTEFIRMMQLLLICENYLAGMYTFPKPTDEELYELASVFRTSAKFSLRAEWVGEEITYSSGGPINLHLDAEYFWKSLTEPIVGSWDPSLQTIPDTTGAINETHRPIVDPEFLKMEDIHEGPAGEPYRALLQARMDLLDNTKNDFLDYIVPFDASGFTKILNQINTAEEDEPNPIYDIGDFNTLDELVAALSSNSAFEQQLAIDTVYNSFRMSKEDFLTFIDIKNKYENVNPLISATSMELDKAADLATNGYKKLWLYTSHTTPPITNTGWINYEINTVTGFPLKYYRVMKMSMAPGRGNQADRSEWQLTLKNWSRQPIVDPDIVPPENIRHFVDGNFAHDKWITRFDGLDTLRDGFVTLFNSSQIVGDQQTGFKTLICSVMLGDDPSHGGTAISYFTELKDREDNGEDIRPRLAEFNTTMAEYRFLRKVYDVLETGVTPVPLITSEYEDVYDILVHIEKQQEYFSKWMLEEFEGNPIAADNPLLLDEEEFLHYQPALNTYPLTNLPVYNTWRSPYTVRRDWLNTLDRRILQKSSLEDDWDTILMNTEESTLHVYRDALITAMSLECETFDHAAERLAKSVFIETKDNCCSKHTRVSQAIETMQGFIFALRNGIYDEYLDGFYLSAPDFTSEWEWLGSYAAWRSAVFVFLYPENILYPTLKRYQSPGFRSLAKSIQESSRINPEQACALAQNYDDYFNDILNLDVKCTTVTNATIAKSEVNTCCDVPDYETRVTYFFAQSTISGKSYWSAKVHSDTSDYGHGFWENLPLPDDVDLIGAHALARDHVDGVPQRRELWVFYSYKKDGKLILAYVKKNLQVAGSTWSEGTDTNDIPLTHPLMDPAAPGFSGMLDSDHALILGTPVKVLSCQSFAEWDVVSFIFVYRTKDFWQQDTYYVLHSRYFEMDDFFELSEPDDLLNDMRHEVMPVLAVRHYTDNQVTGGQEIFGYSIAFNNYIVTRNFSINSGMTNRTRIYLFDVPRVKQIIGFYQKRESPGELVAIYTNTSGGNKAYKVEFTGYVNNEVTYEINTYVMASSQFQQFDRIAPINSIDQWSDAYFAINGFSGVWISSKLPSYADGFNAWNKNNFYSITPAKILDIPVQSAHCIDDMLQRKDAIRQTFLANINAPQGNPNGDFIRTPVTVEYLYEAFYFVPMLVALDQQQRGQFESALDWYRTVYDYTQNLTTNRKIFYGLVLEENVANVFTRPQDWLQDPLNPHLIARMRANAYTRYTLMNIVQCLNGYGDREFTTDTVETVPNARKLYTAALELLDLDEISVADSTCYNTAHCFPASMDFQGTIWENMFIQMQDELGTISDPTLLNETRSDIIDIFENTGLNTAEQFTDAFELIAAALAASVTTPPVISAVASGIGGRITLAMEFIEANASISGSIPAFSEAVSNDFGNVISRISGIPVEDLIDSEYNSSVLQLAEPNPPVSEPYTFQFMNGSGVQQFRDERSFNPLYPNTYGYISNLHYTNTNAYVSQFRRGSRYTPFIDYQFCVPKNPVYDSLKMKSNLELYKIFNCLNIAGIQRELDIYAAPTDSTTGIPVIGANGTLTLPGLNKFRPTQYRFKALIERAKQIVGQTQQIEAQFLSAMEKRDAEYYNLLKARQDLQTAKSTIKLQDLRVRQANDEKEMANLQLARATTSLDYFSTQLENGYSGWEIASIALLETTFVLESIAAGFYLTAGIAYASNITDFNSSANAMSSFGQATSTIAASLSTQAGIFSQIASYERRAQEWTYQRDLANKDIDIANQQITIADDNIRIVSQEREIAQLNADHANDTLEFLKNKFTNAELYSWMSNVLEGVYAYMLNLGTAVARTAEGQLYFERQQTAGPFIQDDYWESPSDNYAASATGAGNADRRGLTGSARLLEDIYKLDQYAFDTDKRKLQLTKTISLAQNFPEAFQQFRQTGVLTFELTNRIFDYDFPGHYLRLINSVKTSVIGLVPVYGGIKASLTAQSTSYTVIGGITYQRIPINRYTNESVSLTSPSNTTGLFEMQQVNPEMLNPFEGMGVESRWEFKMPRFTNRIDYDNIGDVLITVEYTALDSFQYRTQVLQELNNQTSFNRAFSFKNNFADQWYELTNAIAGTDTFGVTFQTKRSDFPAGLDITGVSRLTLAFTRADGFTDEIDIADFGVDTTSPSTPTEGTTVNGIFRPSVNTVSQPFVTWKLRFDNTFQNREMFSFEQVTDILFIITCDAELPPYV